MAVEAAVEAETQQEETKDEGLHEADGGQPQHSEDQGAEGSDDKRPNAEDVTPVKGQQSDHIKIQETETTTNQERKKPRAQQRIEKLIEEKKQLEEQLKAYQEIKKPDASTYDDDDEYEVDHTVYLQTRAEEKRNKHKLSKIEAEAEAALRQAYQESSQGFYNKLSKLPEERRQFVQTNSSLHKPRAPEIEMEVMESPYAAEIFEVMLQDVNKFNGLSDRQFIKEIAKIEARFESANKTMKAPISIPNPPKNLTQSRAGITTDQSNMPDWAKMTYAQAMKMK